ncbi:MAG: fibrobacter succinogenes major paralogous domain-containing protein [Bacteroidetes bacterium]|nr:fibrobacter succinogenes major paralogous domain-containing protein [Bacteroidota bacterium]
MRHGTKIFTCSLAVLALLFLLTSSCKKKSGDETGESQAVTVTDIDGNVYNTVKIGSQLWMAENLKTTRYRNGDPITHVTDNTQWSNLLTGAYCDYNLIYGRLYNWYAVSDGRHICPAGWHVPTDAEWTQLQAFLGGFDVAGGKMKEAGTIHWNGPNTGATNESGFTALPGRMRSWDGSFSSIGIYANLWSSTESWGWYVFYNSTYFGHGTSKNVEGFSVRCLKD